MKSSPTAYIENNLDAQSGYIGSFLTQNDLQFNSVKGSYSIQSATCIGPSPPVPAKQPPPSVGLPAQPTATAAHPSPFQLPVPSPTEQADWMDMHKMQLDQAGAMHMHSNSTPSINHLDTAKQTIFNEPNNQTMAPHHPHTSLQAHLRKKTMIIQNLRSNSGKADSFKSMIFSGAAIAPIDEVKVEYFSEDGEQKKSTRSPNDSATKRAQDRQEMGS